MATNADIRYGRAHNIPRVVVSGSYKRALPLLGRDFMELAALGCTILSPSSVEFVKTVDGFAYTRDEVGLTPREIEMRHLQAIAHADLVWLHAPEGYVGLSGALEIGFARAAGVPIFSRNAPTDVTLKEFVRHAESPTAAVRLASPDSESSLSLAVFESLDRMQSYYAEAARRRGYDCESLRDVVLLMTEELGELARAVRKAVNLPRHGAPISKSIADELADVFLYTLHLANVADIPLSKAVQEKEIENARRSGG